MLEFQAAATPELPGPLQLERRTFGMTRVHVLRGCKGVGKSYLMFLTAAQLLVQDRRTRVVYIGDCGVWRQHGSSIDRELFLANALAAAFIDSSDMQHTIDRWVCERNLNNDIFESSLVSLLCEVHAYCAQEALKVVFIIDNIDAVLGTDAPSREVMGCIGYMKDMSRFVTLLAASDESKAEQLSVQWHAGNTWVQVPFSSSEAMLHIQLHGLDCQFSAWQLKQLFQLTWQHPGELNRLCLLVKAMLAKLPADRDRAFAQSVDVFARTPFTDFVPEPFAAILEWAQHHSEEIAATVLKVLSMSGSAGAYIDPNYMGIVPGDCESTCIYPSPQIARGIVGQFCSASDVEKRMEPCLEKMRRAVYQMLL
ncbi:hypothetical protein H4S02_004485 [Coemansia sp. RSA 2611]|nr:hypothetical protein H4S02_004485 [Coemansia sp. RSA 2611]